MEALKKPCQNANIYEGHIFDIGESRNKTVRDALKFPETSHILFVDDDIVPVDRLSLLKLWAFLKISGESIVSGLYYNKGKTPVPLIMKSTEGPEGIRFQLPKATIDPPTTVVFPVDCVGAGFLLVKREVFEKIKPPWFVFGDPELIRRMKLKTEDISPGEDVYFSFKARDAGYKLFVDCRVRLAHYAPRFVGPKDVLEQLQGGLLRHDMQIENMRRELDAISTKSSG
jgi:hypothetical protein